MLGHSSRPLFLRVTQERRRPLLLRASCGLLNLSLVLEPAEEQAAAGSQVKDYAIDGLRLDTVTYVPRWFLEKFQQRAGVYIVGEVRALPNRGLLLTLGRTCAVAVVRHSDCGCGCGFGCGSGSGSGLSGAC